VAGLVECTQNFQGSLPVAEPWPRAHEARLTGANEGRSRATLSRRRKGLPGRGMVHPVGVLGANRSCWTRRHQLRQETKPAACRPRVRPKLRKASGWRIEVPISRFCVSLPQPPRACLIPQ
jgi:hypothetical protein